MMMVKMEMVATMKMMVTDLLLMVSVQTNLKILCLLHQLNISNLESRKVGSLDVYWMSITDWRIWR